MNAYTTARIDGGIAVWKGPRTNIAHALRIFATTAEATAWCNRDA